MRKSIFLVIAAGAMVLGSLSVACGGDDSSNAQPDSGTPQPPPNPPPPPGGGDGGPDSGDAGCNFATYVINLVSTQTTASSKPDTSLGQGCVDKQDQSEFKSLFP